MRKQRSAAVMRSKTTFASRRRTAGPCRSHASLPLCELARDVTGLDSTAGLLLPASRGQVYRLAGRDLRLPGREVAHAGAEHLALFGWHCHGERDLRTVGGLSRIVR